MDDDNDWKHITPKLIEKIKQAIGTATFNYFGLGWYEKHLKHFALCAIMDI
jgi:hypothetical protein